MSDIFARGASVSRVFLFFGFLLVTTAVRADTLTMLAIFDGTADFLVEMEITGAGGAYDAIGVDTAIGTQPFAPDAGEIQWDFQSGEVSLTDLNAFFTSSITLRFFTNGGGTESVYSMSPPTSPDLAANDFPVPGANLNVTLSADPQRPTATWTGGDSTADLLFLTYQDIFTEDEFGDPPLDPSTSPTSQTLQQDLVPGTYEATLGFWTLFANPSISLVSGPDVFAPAGDDINFVLVGATYFSPVHIAPIPIPAAGLLFPFALLLLGFVRNR